MDRTPPPNFSGNTLLLPRGGTSSPSCGTRKKTARKKCPREIHGARSARFLSCASRPQEFTRRFFPRDLLTVLFDGLSDRGLLVVYKSNSTKEFDPNFFRMTGRVRKVSQEPWASEVRECLLQLLTPLW